MHEPGGMPGSVNAQNARRLLAHIGKEPHEPGSLDGIRGRSLKRRAEPAALATEQLTLAGNQLLQVSHVLVVDERRPRASFLRTEPAPAPAVTFEFLPRNGCHSPTLGNGIVRCLFRQFGKRQDMTHAASRQQPRPVERPNGEGGQCPPMRRGPDQDYIPRSFFSAVYQSLNQPVFTLLFPVSSMTKTIIFLISRSFFFPCIAFLALPRMSSNSF